MILRSLEVEGFRCFDRLLTVSGFDPGLNILSGPNGAGKSTLLRALRHVLVDSHSLSGGAVRTAMAPWGRALNPRIRVVFVQGAEEWRLEKRFLSGAFARLEKLESGVFRPVSEGREAESAVRQMLLAEAAPRGLAGENHLGLLQVLWTPQGAPTLPEWSDDVRTTIQAAFGAALSSRAADHLAGLIQKRFEEYFTPTGQAKKASPVLALQQEVARLREDWQALQTQWQNAARNREALVELRAGIADAASRLTADAPALEQARKALQEISAAVEAELLARQTFEALDLRVTKWRNDIGERQLAEQQAQEAHTRHARLREELAAAEALRPELEALETQLETLHQQGMEARGWPDLLRARELAAARFRLLAQLAATPAPTAAAMAQLRHLHQQLQIKQAGLDAASLQITIEVETAITIEIDGDSRAVTPAVPLQLQTPDSVHVRIPEIARITARSANAMAAELAAEVRGLAAKLFALGNGEELAAIEDRYGARDRLQRQLDAIEAEARPLSARAAELGELAARHPEWETQAPDLNALRDAWKAAKETRDQLKSRYNLPALASAEAAVRTTLEERNRQLAQLAARLAQHAATGPLDALEAQRAEAQTALLLARTRLANLRGAAAPDLAGMERGLRALEGRLQADREAAARIEGELAAMQSQSLYSRLAEAEERLAESTAHLQRHTRRAAAIELLQQTLAGARQNLTAALPGQIAERATRNWRSIAGETAPAIRIDSSWKPAGLDVPDATAALDELSGGEAEQVAFATRLALASQLAVSSRQLAVFDDAFLATDPVRAERVLALLAAAAGHLQILVLTCHPARYQSLPNARHLDLELLKQ